MDCDGEIAEITMEPKTKEISLNFLGNTLRFRCQRCAVFCCKLGGPKLSSHDVERLKRAGYNADMFLDVKQTGLKSTEDGSCVFLSFNDEEGVYQCSIYDFRPTFCRLYPFRFEKSGSQSYMLRFIPCCNGLNTEDGETVDEKFIAKFLQETLFDLIDANILRLDLFFNHNFEKETRII